MWGPFRGQFIDADTGKPIRGGVAYAIWYRIVDNAVQSNQEFYAVQFGVTNERGEYEIPAPPDPPMFSYGYDGPFRSSVVPAHQRIDTTGDTAYTISRWRPFHRIPETQRKYSTSGHYTASIPEHREREMLQQINVIRTQMGLPPFHTLRGGLQ